MTSKAPLHVLITAGVSGIGRAVTNKCLANAARVHVADIDGKQLEAFLSTQSKEEVTGTVTDCTDKTQVARMFEEANSALDGKIDALINCVGISGPVTEIENIKVEEFTSTITSNLTSSFLCTKQVIPQMKKQQSGSIINVSSTAGLMGCPTRSAYVAAKWGIIGFSKTCAMELGADGIRCNAVCPTSVVGRRIDNVIDACAETYNCTAEEVRDAWKSQNSMKLFVEDRDVAEMIYFLISDAGRFISGQAIAVDGNTETLSDTQYTQYTQFNQDQKL